MTRPIPALIALCIAVLLPSAAVAQTAAPASPLKIEPIDSGFVLAPDARFTDVNDKFATLAGVYGGWLTDRTLLVGAGGYWLANRDDNFKMQYFGGVGSWTLGARRKVGLRAGALVGGGSATLAKTYGDLFGEIPAGAPGLSRDHRLSFRGRGGSPITSATLVRVNEDFFIAEPQVNAVMSLTKWLHLDAGVGYRLIGGADLLSEDLRGISGSIALQLGGR
jgi:hypothetical protein